MGLVHADLVLESTFRNRKIDAQALVDTGAVFMVIPEHIALQLGFDIEEFRPLPEKNIPGRAEFSLAV